MLDKMGKLLLKVKTMDVPMAGFVVFLLYNVIAGFSIASSIASFAVCGLYGFKMLLDKREHIKADDELLKKIAILESSIGVLKVSNSYRTQDTSDKSKRVF